MPLRERKRRVWIDTSCGLWYTFSHEKKPSDTNSEMLSKRPGHSADGGDGRKFGFYTLRRLLKREGWAENPRLPYRTWGNGKLVKNGKWREVADEKFPSDDKGSSFEGIDGDNRRGSSPPAWDGDDASAYSQTDYPLALLKTWSN